MFEGFGNFDSAEELNACAKGLLEEGDILHLDILASENGLPKAMLQSYLHGTQQELTVPLNAAIGKLEIERRDLKKDGMPANEIVSYLQMQCFENMQLARGIRRRSKSLEKCMKQIKKSAEERVKVRRGMQIVALPDLEVFKMAEDYYLR